jgi:hypothetical protein
MSNVRRHEVERAALMRHTVFSIIFAFAVLGGCASIPTEVRSPYVGTWVEIISSQPANLVDGRQAIERFNDGRFKLVFLKSYTSRPPCTGQWSLNEADRLYRLTFTSVSCFGEVTNKPVIGEELKFEVLSVEPTRLRFKTLVGSPIASWQARLEGGID